MSATNKNVLPMYAYGKFEFNDATGLKPWLNKFGDLKIHDNTPGVAKVPDSCGSKALADGAACMMPDAQMTGRADDYHKFHFALANGGLAASGHQLLSPRSVGVMMSNSLPGGKTVGEMAAPFAALFAKPWMGYGLGGFSIVAAPGAPEQMPTGAYGWAGAAGTKTTWDPVTGVSWVFYTQQEFSMAPAVDDYTGELTALIYGAIVD